MKYSLQFERIHDTPSHVLRDWRALEVKPTGVCFIPLSGPNYVVLVGILERTACPTITTKIVALDPWSASARSLSGEVYRFGPEAGFTAELNEWYKRRLALHAAFARDITLDLLEALNQWKGDEIHARGPRFRHSD
jgi:hypothetical protein